MTKTKIMDTVNEETVNQVCEGVTNSNGSMITKLVVGALGVAAGIGAIIFYKKKKQNQEFEAEEIENCSNENDKQ